jgi:hypothetical protein
MKLAGHRSPENNVNLCNLMILKGDDNVGQSLRGGWDLEWGIIFFGCPGLNPGIF